MKIKKLGNVDISGTIKDKNWSVSKPHVKRYDMPNVKKFEIDKKYQFLDEIFLRVLKKNPEKMPDVFFRMFKTSPKTVIKFLSNKSNFLEDLSIIFKMPKLIFIKALFD